MTDQNYGGGVSITASPIENWSPSAYGSTLTFFTAAAGATTLGQSMTVQSNGVGINQPSPTYRLDVAGNARFTSFVDAANFVANSTTATTTLAGQLAVGSNALNVLAIG